MADQPPVARPPITAEIAGNRLELIESGDARLRLLLELIGGARSSIKMLMYMFNADRAGEQVRDALAAAAARGVIGRAAGLFRVARPGRRRPLPVSPELRAPIPTAQSPEAGGR